MAMSILLANGRTGIMGAHRRFPISYSSRATPAFPTSLNQSFKLESNDIFGIVRRVPDRAWTLSVILIAKEVERY